MPTLAELQAQLGALQAARASGVRRVEIGDRKMEFKSDSEMAAAIGDIERRIAGLGKPPVNLVYINSAKGLTS